MPKGVDHQSAVGSVISFVDYDEYADVPEKVAEETRKPAHPQEQRALVAAVRRRGLTYIVSLLLGSSRK